MIVNYISMANIAVNNDGQRNEFLLEIIIFATLHALENTVQFNKLCQHRFEQCDLHWDIDVNIKAQLDAITFARLAVYGPLSTSSQLKISTWNAIFGNSHSRQSTVIIGKSKHIQNYSNKKNSRIVMI